MIKVKAVPLITFLVIFSFVLFLGGTMPYFLLYIFSFTFLVPLVHSLIVLKYINGTINVPNQSLYSGESIAIEYEIKNNSIFPIPYLEISSNITKQLTGIDSPSLVLSLGRKKSYFHSETILLKRRGYYEVGEIIVTVRDIFGIFSFRKKIACPTSLLVYPETINLSTFRIISSHQSGEALIQNSVFQDKSRVNSLREYKEGDSVKTIHWKLSAKRSLPIVKEFESYGDTNVTIFLDNQLEHYKYDIDRRLEDKAASTAVSIINYCLNQSIDISLETQNEHGYIKIQGQKKSDYKPFLEALARFKGNGKNDLKLLLKSRYEVIQRSSTIIIITPYLDKEIGSIAIELNMKSYNPFFILITDTENNTGYIDREVEAMLLQEGILIYTLDYKTNIKDTLEVYNG